MKILVYKWNAYNLQDILSAFSQAGHETAILEKAIQNPEEDNNYVDQLCCYLKCHSYDFLFSVNYFPVLAQACHESGLLYVCWTCDSPLLAMYHESVFYGTNIIFTFDRSNYETFSALGVANIFHLPLAVHTARLSSQMDTTQPQKYPVCFVGSLYEKNSYDSIASLLPPYLSGYLEGAMNAQILVSGGNLLEKLLTDDICLMLENIMDYQKSEKSFADTRTLFSNTVLGFKAASLERQRCLNALSLHVPTHLFTASPPGILPLVRIHPPVNYLSEMPQVFFESKINLNMTIPNIKTGIPLRVWDILGSGGFALTNFQAEMEGVFQAGGTLDIFESEEELTEKTDFYLKHGTLRRKIAKNGQKLVSEEHNYSIRIQQMLATLKPFLS